LIPVLEGDLVAMFASTMRVEARLAELEITVRKPAAEASACPSVPMLAIDDVSPRRPC
jgi:hypothetical protein